MQELVEALIVELFGEWEVEVVPWFTAEDDPVSGLVESLRGVIRVASAWGPLIRAVVEAAPTNSRLEQAWNNVVSHYFDAATQRIELDQTEGRAREFDARNTAISLCLMNVSTFVHHFGQPEQSDPKEVWTTLACLWVTTIYGDRAWVRVEKEEFE